MITDKAWIYSRVRNLLGTDNVPIHSIRFEYDKLFSTKITSINFEVHSSGYHDQLIKSGFTFIKDGYFSKIYAFPKGLLD